MKDDFEIRKQNGIEYLQFKCLQKFPEIKHAYLLKTNGMNLRMGKEGENIATVKENLKKISQVIGFDYCKIIRPDYEHTNTVVALRKKEIDMIESEKSKEEPYLKGNRLKEVDGLLTKEKGYSLLSTNADCNLLLLYDPINKVIGNIHAGWRGTFGKISQNAIRQMKEVYNVNPQNVLCCFCPSIRKCHFEVDEDVAINCQNLFSYTGKIDLIITKGEIKEGKQKYFIDTVKINQLLLEEEGVLPQNIVDCGICSVCHAEKIHSRRADGINFGLGGALIEQNAC